MWWNIRTFRHVAHVAEITFVHDIPIHTLGNSIELAGRRLVDRIKQSRECVTEIETTPTSMADIEYAFEFLEKRRLIEILIRLPVDGMSRRRL
jgi:hypothetical protein